MLLFYIYISINTSPPSLVFNFGCDCRGPSRKSLYMMHIYERGWMYGLFLWLCPCPDDDVAPSAISHLMQPCMANIMTGDGLAIYVHYVWYSPTSISILYIYINNEAQLSKPWSLALEINPSIHPQIDFNLVLSYDSVPGASCNWPTATLFLPTIQSLMPIISVHASIHSVAYIYSLTSCPLDFVYAITDFMFY